MPIPSHSTRHALRPHPASPSPPGVDSLVVDVAWDGRHLALDYRLVAQLAALSIPAPATAQRTDGLWRHTCFEVFVPLPATSGYLEYNFSPSGAWAAYRFDDYRAGMVSLPQGPTSALECHADSRSLQLHIALDLGWLELQTGALRLGLTAVLEDRAGGLSYWALAHASEKPDFHRAESFVAAIS